MVIQKKINRIEILGTIYRKVLIIREIVRGWVGWGFGKGSKGWGWEGLGW